MDTTTGQTGSSPRKRPALCVDQGEGTRALMAGCRSRVFQPAEHAPFSVFFFCYLIKLPENISGFKQQIFLLLNHRTGGPFQLSSGQWLPQLSVRLVAGAWEGQRKAEGRGAPSCSLLCWIDLNSPRPQWPTPTSGAILFPGWWAVW